MSTRRSGTAVLVTHVHTTVGRAIAEELLDAGTRVVAQVSPGCPAPTGALVIETALDDPDAPRALVAAAAERIGRIGAVVIVAPPSEPIAAQSLEPGRWSHELKLGLTVPFLLCQAAYEPLAAATPAAIVLVGPSGTASAESSSAAALAVAHGLVGLARILAVEWAQDGIRVNYVAAPPGGGGETVAGAVGFLLSDEAAYVTGAELAASERLERSPAAVGHPASVDT